MKTTTALGLSCSIILTLAAFTAKERPAPLRHLAEPSSYLAEIHGDLHVSTRGEAKFGLVEAVDGTPAVFTLSLGANGSDGSVLFTRTNGTRFAPGTYSIGGRDNGADEILALIMTGSATRPTGVFRGKSGYLIVTSATDNVISGRFQVAGTGFIASNPDDESRPIKATGMFTATRQ
jgi:hypothetical protein